MDLDGCVTVKKVILLFERHVNSSLEKRVLVLGNCKLAMEEVFLNTQLLQMLQRLTTRMSLQLVRMLLHHSLVGFSQDVARVSIIAMVWYVAIGYFFGCCWL